MSDIMIDADRSDSPPAAMVLASEADQPGLHALARLPEDEFQARLEMFGVARKRVQQVQRALMQEDVHYGTIPGTDKPTLFKAGAEVLTSAFGMVVTYAPETAFGDGKTSPPITVTVRARLHLGDSEGPTIAEGLGACNSWEKKYRYRTANLSCPSCKAETLFRSKHEPEFFCWAKKGGCGATFPLDDERITGQPRGQVDNPDPYELLNTIIKMAKKRARVDAVLEATATSDLFTQDLEEMEDVGPAPRTETKQTPPPAAKGKPAAKRKSTPKPNRPRGEVFYDTAKAAGLSQPDADEIAQEFLRDAFGVKPGQESEPQFSVLLEVLQGAGSLPPGYEVDPTLPEADQAAVHTWLEKQQAKRRRSELESLLTEATVPNVLDWLAELYGLTTDDEALAVSPERWQAARIYAKADGHPIVLDEIGRRGDGDVDAGVESLVADARDLAAYTNAADLVDHLEALVEHQGEEGA